MKHEAQIKLQAFLDEELSPVESRQVADWVARDQEAAALLTELRQTGNALKGFEDAVRVPESREFYWSKIERRLQSPAPERRESALERWLLNLRRLTVPATAFAVLAILGVIVARQGTPTPAAPHVETALADTGAFTYRDYSAGATLVWLSYPADNEVAQPDDFDTFD